MGIPLTEKYRPKTVTEIVGNEKAKNEVVTWLRNFLQGNQQYKAILLYGPPGTGKTSLVHALANDFNLELIELNASDSRTWKIIKKVVAPASTSVSFDNKRKLVLLDEIDGIHKREDLGAEKAILEVLKVSKNPIIMVANDVYADCIKNLRQNPLVKPVEFKAPSTHEIVRLLEKICRNEGVVYEREALFKIAEKNQGDIRACLNDLEALIPQGKITVKDIEILGTREKKEYSIFNTLAKLFKAQSCLSASLILSQAYDIDPEEFMLWLAENIPKEYEKPHEVYRAYDCLSKADLFFGRIIKTQEWRFLKYASFLMSAGVATAKDQRYRKFTKYSYPSLLLLLAKTKEERQRIKEISEKIKEKLHVSAKLASREFVPWLKSILKYNELTFAKLAVYLNLSKSDVKALCNNNEKLANKIWNLMEQLKKKIKETESKKEIKTEKPKIKKEEKKEASKSILDFF